jgi:hypothetical protein
MEVKGYSRNCGTRNNPGTKNFMYLVCPEDIDVFPAMKTTTGTGDSITVDGNIVLKAGKAWAKVEIIPNTGRIKHDGVGVITSKAFNNMYEFKLPTDIASDEWAEQHQNACLVAAVPQKNGRFRLLGNIEIPASIESATADRGASNADESSWAFQIMDEVGAVAPYYDGTFDLTV